MELKLTTIGSGLGFIFPNEAQAHMHISEGDVVHITEVAGGSYLLTPFDPQFGEQMEMARTIMREDRDLLRDLAK